MKNGITLFLRGFNGFGGSIDHGWTDRTRRCGNPSIRGKCGKIRPKTRRISYSFNTERKKPLQYDSSRQDDCVSPLRNVYESRAIMLPCCLHLLYDMVFIYLFVLFLMFSLFSLLQDGIRRCRPYLVCCLGELNDVELGAESVNASILQENPWLKVNMYI